MRRRIIGVAVASAALAVLLFLLPLAVAVLNLNMAQEHAALEHEAQNAALVIDPAFSNRDRPELPAAVPGTELGLYDAAGRLIAGTGPEPADAETARALGLAYGAEDPSWLVGVVPVAAQEKTAGAVRAAGPAAAVWQRVGIGWGALSAAGLLAIAVAWLLARRLARQVSRPIEQLAEASARLGQGEFELRLPRTGVPEVDRAGQALNSAAAGLGELIKRERQLAANVSHQLRTPLAGLRATLETALSDPAADLRTAAGQAISRADRLEATIEEVTALSRGPVPALADVDLGALVERIAEAWRGPLAARARPLYLRIEEDVPAVAVAPPAIEQILAVLLDNALRHGAGTVCLGVRALDRAVAVDVADDGCSVPDADVFLRGVSGHGGSGVGLALARRLAEDQGGRLLLAQRKPRTQFTLLLPRENLPAVSSGPAPSRHQ